MWRPSAPAVTSAAGASYGHIGGMRPVTWVHLHQHTALYSHSKSRVSISCRTCAFGKPNLDKSASHCLGHVRRVGAPQRPSVAAQTSEPAPLPPPLVPSSPSSALPPGRGELGHTWKTNGVPAACGIVEGASTSRLALVLREQAADHQERKNTAT